MLTHRVPQYQRELRFPQHRGIGDFFRASLMFNGRRLAVALAIGAIGQAVLLAFGLHASLLFASISTGATYWVLNGMYFVVAIAICLAARG